MESQNWYIDKPSQRVYRVLETENELEFSDYLANLISVPFKIWSDDELYNFRVANSSVTANLSFAITATVTGKYGNLLFFVDPAIGEIAKKKHLFIGCVDKDTYLVFDLNDVSRQRAKHYLKVAKRAYADFWNFKPRSIISYWLLDDGKLVPQHNQLVYSGASDVDLIRKHFDVISLRPIEPKLSFD